MTAAQCFASGATGGRSASADASRKVLVPTLADKLPVAPYARGIAALVRAGLPVLRFGKLQFFSGAGLVSVLAPDQGDGREFRDTIDCNSGFQRQALQV